MTEKELEELVKKLGGEIINTNQPVKTVQQAIKATGVEAKQIIKSLLLITEKQGPILVIVNGESKVDFNKLSKMFGKVRFATLSEVKQITGFEPGEVPPVGIKAKTIIDTKVLENKLVIGGGGKINKLSKLNPERIVEYQNATIADISTKSPK